MSVRIAARPSPPTRSGCQASSSGSWSEPIVQAARVAQPAATATSAITAGGAARSGAVPDVERVPAPPEQAGGAETECRLLEIEALQQLDRRQGEHQPDRDLPGAMPPGTEVEGDDDERDARRHCQGVEDGHGLHRLELEQQVVAPGDRRRQRRGEIDEADGECDRGREAREPISPADRSQRRGPAMQPDPPGGGIAPRGHDVLPVLGDEPDPERTRDGGNERQVPRVERNTHADEREDAEPELPFVDPPPEHEDARAEPMTVEANHE